MPLIVSGPGIAPGGVRTDLAELIDLAPTTLSLAGGEIPAWMQGRNLLAVDGVPR
ncbi:MAG: sulfatase/phosphatase domain-containing protein, partial [Planctomycetaceae bacterium]